MLRQASLHLVSFGLLVTACGDASKNPRADASLADAQGDAQGEPLRDAEVDSGSSAPADAGSAADAGDPLCLCGCVVRDDASTDASCTFDYASLGTEQFHHELEYLRVGIGGTRASVVTNLAACGPNLGGFYVDDPSAPSTLTLCPISCERLHRAGSAVFGRDCGAGL